MSVIINNDSTQFFASTGRKLLDPTQHAE